MSDVAPPIPDPDTEPKKAREMAAEGDREGPVLADPSHSDEIAIERKGTEADPQFARNGE